MTTPMNDKSPTDLPDSRPPEAAKSYVVINGLMYQKVDEGLQAIPLPLTQEAEAEVAAVWEQYDKRGRPFVYYHK